MNRVEHSPGTLGRGNPEFCILGADAMFIPASDGGGGVGDSEFGGRGGGFFPKNLGGRFTPISLPNPVYIGDRGNCDFNRNLNKYLGAKCKLIKQWATHIMHIHWHPISHESWSWHLTILVPAHLWESMSKASKTMHRCSPSKSKTLCIPCFIEPKILHTTLIKHTLSSNLSISILKREYTYILDYIRFQLQLTN